MDELLLFRMAERLALSVIILIVAVVVMVGFWRAVQKVDLTEGGKLGVAGSVTLSTPVFVLLALVGYAWVSLSNPVTLESTRGADASDGRGVETSTRESRVTMMATDGAQVDLAVSGEMRRALDALRQEIAKAQTTATGPAAGASAATIRFDPAPPEDRANDISRVQERLWAVNCASRSAVLPATAERHLVSAKLALIEPVWDPVLWGPFDAFADWARSDGAGRAPEAEPLALFTEVHPQC